MERQELVKKCMHAKKFSVEESIRREQLTYMLEATMIDQTCFVGEKVVAIKLFGEKLCIHK